MEKRSPNISPGDLVRAIRELGLEDSPAVGLVAGMLGFDLVLADREASAQTAANRDARSRATADQEDATAAAREEEGASPSAPRAAQRAVAVELSSAPGGKEEWIPEVEPFPPQDEEVDITPPPLVPLFTPRWTRGILSASLATSDEEGPLDVERATEMLANCESVGSLPVVASKTMRRGAHLLLDAGQTMMPFRRDQAWLTRAILRVVGESHVEVFSFVGSPLRGAGGGAYPWPEYKPPLPGTPVVVLTDLGVCRTARGFESADEGEWAECAEGIRRAGCALIALVPYKPSRWPRSLARRMTIIRWDRGTTASTVSEILRRSAEVRRT